MSGYLSHISNQGEFKKLVRVTSKRVSELKDKLKFEAIVVTGLSGSSIGFPVSYITGIPILYVRKHKASTHGDSVEGLGVRFGEMSRLNYIILDDFVHKGKTVKRLLKRMKEVMPHSKCSGIIAYCNAMQDPFIDKKKVDNLPIYVVSLYCDSFDPI